MKLVFIFVLFSFLDVQNIIGQKSIAWTNCFYADGNMNQTKLEKDVGGNTWTWMLCNSKMQIEDIGTTIDGMRGMHQLFIRTDSLGKNSQFLELSSERGMWGEARMSCSPDNELWVVIPFQEKLKIKTIWEEKVLENNGNTLQLGLVVINPQGRIRLVKTIEGLRFSELNDLDIDDKGGVHILTRLMTMPNEVRRGMNIRTFYNVEVVHTQLNSNGEIGSNKVLEMGEMVAAAKFGHRLICVPGGGYYISGTYSTSVTLADSVIVPNQNPKSTDFNFDDEHALMMYFDAKGDFSWYHVVSGFGAQYFSAMDVDSSQIYFAMNFQYEYCLSDQNEIVLSERSPENSTSIVLGSFSHNGDILWTQRVVSRNYSGSFVHCYAIATNLRGEVVYGCSFSDSVVVQGLQKRYILKQDRKLGYASFLIIGDSEGRIKKVRRDIRQKEGKAFIHDAGYSDGLYTVTGNYFARMVPTGWDDKEQAFTSSEARTDIRVKIGDEQGDPFYRHNTGALYTYSFREVDNPLSEPDSTDVVQVPGDEMDILQALETWQPGVQVDAIEVTLLPDSTIVSDPFITDMNDQKEPVLTTREEDSVLKLYPNPTRGPLNVEVNGWSGTIEIRIHDTSGRMMLSYVLFNESFDLHWSHDVSEWSAGTYLVTVIGPNREMMTKRLVITG